MSSNNAYLMSVAELDALPYVETHRYELIEGELHISYIPGLSHQKLLGDLLVEMANYLRQDPVGTVVPGPGVILSALEEIKTLKEDDQFQSPLLSDFSIKVGTVFNRYFPRKGAKAPSSDLR